MPMHRVSETARIPAPANVAYGVIADYEHGHPRIVPPKYFGPLVVERGGRGAGTEIRFTMRVLGRELPARGVVTEPEPGRVLVESYPDSGVVTRFTVTPAGPAACDVEIASDLPTHVGIIGKMERALLTRLLTRIYREELALLDQVASAEAPDAGAVR